MLASHPRGLISQVGLTLWPSNAISGGPRVEHTKQGGRLLVRDVRRRRRSVDSVCQLPLACMVETATYPSLTSWEPAASPAAGKRSVVSPFGLGCTAQPMQPVPCSDSYESRSTEPCAARLHRSWQYRGAPTGRRTVHLGVALVVEVALGFVGSRLRDVAGASYLGDVCGNIGAAGC